jgi:hypothetical protein
MFTLMAPTLLAQELPTEMPYAEGDGPRIVNPDPTRLLAMAPDDLLQAIRVDAAERVGVEADNVSIETSEAVDWPDASLGCPGPQMGYAQVITPGFLVVVDVGGNRLHYHTDSVGRFIVCDGPARHSGLGT